MKSTTAVHDLSPRLRRLFDFLQFQLERHNAAGSEVTVDLQEDGTYRLQSVDCDGYVGGCVAIYYGGSQGKRPAHQLSFVDEVCGSFRYGQKEFVGLDEDGERVRIVFPMGVANSRRTTKPRREVIKSSPTDQSSTSTSDAGGGLTHALLHPAVARALVFRSAQLGRIPDESGAWDIAVELGRARSESPRLWQEHRCILEYLVNESESHGLSLTVPGPKIMTAMNMRFTKGSIEYGKRALARLRDTVVEAWGPGNQSGASGCQELRFLESFMWGENGGVAVVLSPSAVATYRPGDSKALREQLIKEDSDTWWRSWTAGFVANGSSATVSRADLLALAGTVGEEAKNLWAYMTEVPSEQNGLEDAFWRDKAYSAAESAAYWAKLSFSHSEVNDGKAEKRLIENKVRMTDYLRSGGFVQDGSNVVAWRIVGDDRMEIVPFEKSGLPRQGG